MMDYVKFQQIVAKLDPRTPLFLDTPYDICVPHIYSYASDCSRPVVVVSASDESVDVKKEYKTALAEGKHIVITESGQLPDDVLRSMSVTFSTLSPKMGAPQQRHARFYLLGPFSFPFSDLRRNFPQLLLKFSITVDEEGDVVGDLPDHVQSAYSFFQALENVDAADEESGMQISIAAPQELFNSSMVPQHSPKHGRSDPFEWSGRSESSGGLLNKDTPAEAEVDALPNLNGVFEVMFLVVETNTSIVNSAIWDTCPVWLKSISLSYSEKERGFLSDRLLLEGVRTMQLRHPHIINAYGTVPLNGSLQLVVEGGERTVEQIFVKLRLRNQRWSLENYLTLAQHTLRALVYLEKQAHVVHRDVACRSIALMPGGIFKLFHFGTSVAVPMQPHEDKIGGIPVRWTSPEGLRGQWAPHCDLWSFGVMMYEALQYITVLPYENHVDALEGILSGEILPRPSTVPVKVWEKLVAPCFYPVESRPSPSKLLQLVDTMLTAWSDEMLQAVVPFTDDVASFEEYNGLRIHSRPQSAASQATSATA